MIIDDRLILSRDGGYTLTTVLGRTIQLAEKAFGKRDLHYTILGFHFTGRDSGISFFEDPYTVLVRLGTNCLYDLELACYQLAHETVHLLSPVKSELVTVLEEGVATRFGCDFMLNHSHNLGWPILGSRWSSTSDQAYNRAMFAADRLLRIDQDAISSLRQIQPAISCMNPEMIHSRFPDLSLNDAAELCEPFPEWKEKLSSGRA